MRETGSTVEVALAVEMGVPDVCVKRDCEDGPDRGFVAEGNQGDKSETDHD